VALLGAREKKFDRGFLGQGEDIVKTADVGLDEKQRHFDGVLFLIRGDREGKSGG